MEIRNYKIQDNDPCDQSLGNEEGLKHRQKNFTFIARGDIENQSYENVQSL